MTDSEMTDAEFRYLDKGAACLTTAYHEAGHAVAAFFLRTGFRRVTIMSDGEAAGHSLDGAGGRFRGQPDCEMTPAIRDYLERHIRVLLAGEIAQRRHSPRSVRRHHGESDRQRAVDLAFYINGDTRAVELYMRWLSCCTEGFITTRWAAVEAVAQALAEHKTLSRGQVRALIVEPRA